IPRPLVTKAHLDDFIIGQDNAKIRLSVALYDHFTRQNRNASQELAEIQIEKSNVLLMGPSGCGKTFLVQSLAKRFSVPFAIADATTLTEAGYVGQDVESILTPLMAAAKGSLPMAESGIVYLDEFDKIARKDGSNTRDVSGE